MASTLRVKRRTSGGTGAPASLKSGEIAYNNMDGVLYIGFGDDGAGNATSVKAFARDNFNPGSAYQVQDADLDALAALSTTGMSVRTGNGTWTLRSITGTAGRITVTNGDGVAGPPTIDLATLAIGTAVAGGSTKFTVDTYGRVTNAGQASLSDLSAPTADFALGTFGFQSSKTPTVATDYVNKAYADALIQGLRAKDSVRAAFTANQALSGGVAFPIADGVQLAAGDRAFLPNQTAAAENGVYVLGGIATAWTLTRAADADTWSELAGAYFGIEAGATYGDKVYLNTNDRATGTLGTTGATFIVFPGSSSGSFSIAGNGLVGTGSTLDVVGNNGLLAAADSIGLTGQALALHQVSTSVDTVIYATGAGAFASTALTTYGRSLIGAANAGAARTTLGLVIGTDVQAYSARTANEQALNITTADNVLLYGAAGAVVAYGLGATGKSLMGAATAAAAKTLLALGTMADQNANAVAITGGTIDGVTLDGGTF